jgi:hypothetical protein
MRSAINADKLGHQQRLLELASYGSGAEAIDQSHFYNRIAQTMQYNGSDKKSWTAEKVEYALRNGALGFIETIK